MYNKLEDVVFNVEEAEEVRRFINETVETMIAEDPLDLDRAKALSDLGERLCWEGA